MYIVIRTQNNLKTILIKVLGMKIFLRSILLLGVVILCNMQFTRAFDPRVSIITSIYKGDFFIAGFLQDITQQTIFDECELILINANSPGNEEETIAPYLQRYKNIKYIKLSEDPGIYGVWNLGIKLARAEYVTNANLDDRLHFECYQKHAQFLDDNPDVDLVYSGCYFTRVANETFEHNSSQGDTVLHSVTEFNRFKMFVDGYPFPNNHPMWRKSMHIKYGLFDATYKSSGDMEMWLRAAFLGDAKFEYYPEILSLYYSNPLGLSTRPDSLVYKENDRIKKTYRDLLDGCFDHIEYLDD